MKKLRIAAIVIFVVTVISALALTANAKWWDENPFTDVKSSHWYYDAVRIANENGLVNGMSDTKYSPSVKMTRAMLVQVLYNADGGVGEYTGTPFTDVKPNHWYAKAVQWAYDNEITSGVSETKFGASAEIKREELAAMLYRYAEYKGMAIENSVSIAEFPDADKVSSWAVKNFEWAYGNGIISGSKKADGVYLNPRNSATRAECAQMLSKYLYLNPVYEINGNDISLYTIVYDNDPPACGDALEDAAYDLAAYIEGSLGYALPVVTDETEVGEYEILVGKTNREDMGLVSFDRNFEDDQMFSWKVEGNYLVISGIEDSTSLNDHTNKGHRNVEGTKNAVYYFAVKELGVEEYCTTSSFGEITEYTPDPVISLEDGYIYTDMVYFRGRTFYMKGGVNGASEYHSSIGTNMSTWISGDWDHENDVGHDDTPCLSNEDNINSVINNVLLELERNPHKTGVSLYVNDSDGYCRCADCSALYTQYKARSATICLLANRVSDAMAERFPEAEIILGAYEYSQKPPTGITLRDNIIVEIVTINNCNSHSYLDKTCKLNKTFSDDVDGWNAICKETVSWDHTGGFIYFLSPFPDWDTILGNTRYFADTGSRGILINSVFYGEDLPNGEGPEVHADFGPVRAYMLSKIYMDPYMSEEEFDYYLNSALKVYFGEGWNSLREYLDLHTEIANSSCSRHHAHPSGFHDYAEITKVADHINDLWADAKSKANAEQLERIELCEASWIFLYQNATYESRYTNGTEAQRAEYEELNTYLYNFILDKRIIWTEGTLNPLDTFDATKAPSTW